MRAFHEVRSYNSDFMVWHSSYDNISFLAHWHKEIELIYVRSGTCHLSITDVNFTAHAGDLAICESGAIHYSDSHNMDNSLDFIIFDTSIISPIFQNPHFINPLVTKEELEKVEAIVNEAIRKKIDVILEEMTPGKAYEEGAVGVFSEKYGEMVKVYTIPGYSKEICGGPHAENTGELVSFKIIKEEASSAGVRRIKAVIHEP